MAIDLITIAACIGIPLLSVTGAWLVAQATKEHMNAITQKLADLQAAIDQTKAQVDKAKSEIVAKVAELDATIQTLTDIINNGTVTPEVQAALDAVTASVTALKESTQAIDDLNPDAV